MYSRGDGQALWTNWMQYPFIDQSTFTHPRTHGTSCCFSAIIESLEFKGDVTRDDSQRRFLAQHSAAILLRHCFEWLQHCSNIATPCCTKNRRWESSRVTSPWNSEIRTTTRKRFSQYWVLLTREPASFWRENVIAVVILLRVYRECSSGRKRREQVIKCKRFYHFAIERGLNLLPL